MLEDISSGRHVDDVVDDEFTESCQQIPPFVQGFDLVGFVFLISLYRRRQALPQMNKGSKTHAGRAPVSLTHALALVVLVDKDVVQDKVQQLVLQGAIGVKDQGLETLPATRN